MSDESQDDNETVQNLQEFKTVKSNILKVAQDVLKAIINNKK